VRRSLAFRSFLISALIVAVFIVPLALLVRSVARERALTLGRSDARAITPILSLAGDPRVSGAIRAIGAEGAPRRLSVVFPDGSVLGGDEVIERDRLADPKALARARAGKAFVVSTHRGEVVYEPVLRSNGTIAVIRVFVPDSLLGRNVLRSWLGLAMIGVALIGFAVVAADRLARSVVRSVAALADTANRLGRGDVTARNEPSGPAEVREVGASLNQLAVRIDELLGTERAAAADLQHRLRTPVTALRAEAAAMTDESNRRRIEFGLEELTRTIDQIIREAAEPIRRGIGVSADLAEITRERSAFWRVLAEDQRRPFELDVPSNEVEVAVVATDLAAVIDVLVDNVFSHTPEGTAFWVTLREIGNLAQLDVDDAGPGIVNNAVKGRGSSGSGSTGLGVDIARKIVEGAGGRLLVANRSGGGTRATVTLPRTSKTA
jgi:signal transduction histidine kinase